MYIVHKYIPLSYIERTRIIQLRTAYLIGCAQENSVSQHQDPGESSSDLWSHELQHHPTFSSYHLTFLLFGFDRVFVYLVYFVHIVRIVTCLIYL